MNSIAPSVADQMTQVYVFVDDYLKAHPAQAAWWRSNNDAPAFTDAEVITLGLLQGVFGCATHKRTYQLVAANWRAALPHLCSYGQWLARLHRMAALVGQLIQAALGLCGLSGRLYLIDGLPIRVCKSIRHGRGRLLREDGAYFGKSSTGWFSRAARAGASQRANRLSVLTPANSGEREAALALCLSVDGGIVPGDLGYRSRGDWLGQTLAEEADMLLIHPADAGDKADPERARKFCPRAGRDRLQRPVATLH